MTSPRYILVFCFALAGLLGFQASVPAVAQDRKAIKPQSKDDPLPELISGYYYSSLQTRAMQDDDFDNPAFLWMDQGEKLWQKVEGDAGKSCSSCHGKAAAKMRGAATHYPRYYPPLKKVINLEQRINLCRTGKMQAPAWRYESDELLAMSTYVSYQSRGMPVAVKIDGPAKAAFEAGKAFYARRIGQLDLSCSNCHDQHYGEKLRSDLVSQGHSNGFPAYRLKWQKLGSLHRRFRGCNKQVRAKPLKAGSQDYVNLELYLAWRGNGLPLETPAVRR